MYRDHDRGVHEFFTGGDAPAERRERFLELDITTLAKENGGRDVWERLCGFLGVSEEVKRDIAGTPFPHRFVFQYSSWDQPMAQFRSIVARLGRRWRWLGLAFVLLFASRFWDMSQCTRVCRVANGFGNPDVRGFTGSWVQEGVEGRRMYLAPAECECFLSAVAEKGEGSRKLSDSGGRGEKGDGRGDHKLCIVSLGTPECLATTRRSQRRSSGGSRRRRSVAATGGCMQVPMMHEGPAEERARCPSSTAGNAVHALTKATRPRCTPGQRH